MALQPTTRKKNNGNRRLIIILAVLLLMIGGAYMFYFGGGKKSAQPQVQPPGMVAMPVVKADLPSGTRISNQMYRIKYVRPNEVPTDAILSTAQFVGRYATRPIASGEYIREDDVTEPGAHKGFSGFAKHGKRSVVLDGKLFPGMAESLNIGDRIDLLSIGSPTGAGSSRRGALTRAQQSANTIEGGGVMPGDTLVKRLARQGLGNTVSATTATLIAEDAEVVAVPKPRTRRSPGINYFVLQMEPEQAHITMLSVASGATLRAVFRPFSDRTRITPVHQATSTVRTPKPQKDPDAITIIAGSSRTLQMPYSKIYSGDSIAGRGIDDDGDFGDEGQGETRTSAEGLVPIQESPATAPAAPAPRASTAASAMAAPATNNNTMNIVDESYFDQY
ncbi:MAG TPA: Flp pilus assembly protein CpaB [Methylophilus sp.]|nr:Flp pilus assembly protein CpaB [Methylophilus sp.]HQQ32950.1 Flp pilus assembly protein CpaB [Methylophilus sp.]